MIMSQLIKKVSSIIHLIDPHKYSADLHLCVMYSQNDIVKQFDRLEQVEFQIDKNALEFHEDGCG